MKKFILPLMLLLLAAGFLFAVESDPSAVVGYVKYDCLPQLNLIALPMDQGYNMVSELSDAYPGMMDAISYWDAANQYWFTAIDLGGFWDPDFAIPAGSVLFVNSLGSFSLYSMGDLPATNATYPMLAGLNTLMIPLNRSDIAMAGDLGTDLGITDAISNWDAANQYWFTAIDLGGFWDPDFSISIGSPLMVNAFSTGTWPSRAASPTLKLKNN